MENIIEYLVPLIFILAFIIPKFKKQQQKSSPSEPAEIKKPQTGMLSRLNKMLEEYSESDQEAIKKEKEEDESHDWFGESYQDEDDEEEKQAPPKVAMDVRANAPVENPDLEKRTHPAISGMNPMTRSKDDKIPQKRTSSLYAASAVSKKDLRNAIVWSEILGPPKALRKE